MNLVKKLQSKVQANKYLYRILNYGWWAPLIIFVLLFLTMYLKVLFLNSPRPFYSLTFGGVLNYGEMLAYTVLGICLILIATVFYYGIKKSFEQHHNIKSWIIRIVNTYLIVVLSFAFLCSYVAFSHEFSYEISRLNYYVPASVELDEQGVNLEYIKEVNKTLKKSEILSDSAFKGLEMKILSKQTFEIPKSTLKKM